MSWLTSEVINIWLKWQFVNDDTAKVHRPLKNMFDTFESWGIQLIQPDK